jgi:hypothetical protein
MVDRPSVEFGGDHDVLVAYIAGDYVLVELDGELFAYS